MTTKIETTHTPTPWTFDGAFITQGKDRFHKTGEVIATVEDTENWIDNAEFIVRAVNEYENLKNGANSWNHEAIKLGEELDKVNEQNKALLEAARFALNSYGYAVPQREVIEKLEKAVAQAEGR